MKAKKKKPTRGGARPGAGRPENSAINKPVKEPARARLYPEQKAAILARYGSIQSGLDIVFNEDFIRQNKPE